MADMVDVDGISLETAAVNKWFASAMADPKMQAALKADWFRLAEETLKGADQFMAGISALPADQRQDLQSAIAKVAGEGGAVRLTQPSGQGAGTLVVSGGSERGAATPAFSVGVFHCTFDGFFRHWHCGWGPAKKI